MRFKNRFNSNEKSVNKKDMTDKVIENPFSNDLIN